MARNQICRLFLNALILTSSGVRQALTMQLQAQMAAAAACMHVECIHAAAATAATCKHAASTALAATHATAHPNGLQAVGGGVAGCALLELPESLPQWKRGDRKREET
uniref:Secreted protein n=1 Tax=Chlamydomonas euryale TaxID=1486919 RepID=A0A6U2CV82_9CHLO|mmetsp:Transcript_15661/g.46202  ORF Transcript_15661/g.46202 Transcript_15661/m.46202 type:complete len:108 (+) Transcript_15661:232-555(+)